MSSEGYAGSNDTGGAAQTRDEGRSEKKRKKQSKKKGFWKIFTEVLVMISVVALVVLVLWQLFKKKETLTSTTTQQTKTKIMVCEAKAPKDPFFEVEGATDVEHTIKVTYRNGVANKISYEYEAELGSEEAATKAEAETHAKYNKYMGSNAEGFSANFMPMGTEYKIDVTTDVNNLGTSSSRIFFMSEEDFRALDDYKIENLRKIIQTAGFHCEMGDD